MLSILLRLLALSPAVYHIGCSHFVDESAIVAGEAAKSVSVIDSPAIIARESSELFQCLPDAIVYELLSTHILDDLPALVCVNKRTRQRIENLFPFPQYLAGIYQLPALNKLPFDQELVRLCVLLKRSTSDLCGKASSPSDLFKLLKAVWRPSPLTENLVLALYDHISENSMDDLYFLDDGFGRFVFRTILLHRGLEYFVKVNQLFSVEVRTLDSQSFPELPSLMVKWFNEERKLFVDVFLVHGLISWSDDLFLHFLHLATLFVPDGLKVSFSTNFWVKLIHAITSPHDAETDILISSKIRSFLNTFMADNGVSQLLLNHEHSNLNEELRLKLAVVMILSQDYLKALLLFPIFIRRDSPYLEFFMKFPEFYLQMLTFSPNDYRKSFHKPPQALFADPDSLQSVFKSRWAFIASLFKSLCMLYPRNTDTWLEIAIKYGSVEDFRRIFSKASQTFLRKVFDLDVWNKTIAFKKDELDLMAYLMILYKASKFMKTFWFGINERDKCFSRVSIKKLLPHPQALETVLRFFSEQTNNSFLFIASLKRVQRSKLFKEASEATKVIIRGYYDARDDQMSCSILLDNSNVFIASRILRAVLPNSNRG